MKHVLFIVASLFAINTLCADDHHHGDNDHHQQKAPALYYYYSPQPPPPRREVDYQPSVIFPQNRFNFEPYGQPLNYTNPLYSQPSYYNPNISNNPEDILSELKLLRVELKDAREKIDAQNARLQKQQEQIDELQKKQK